MSRRELVPTVTAIAAAVAAMSAMAVGALSDNPYTFGIGVVAWFTALTLVVVGGMS
jgi:hypothetical protein